MLGVGDVARDRDDVGARPARRRPRSAPAPRASMTSRHPRSRELAGQREAEAARGAGDEWRWACRSSYAAARPGHHRELVLGPRSDEALADRVERGLRAVGEAELGEDVLTWVLTVFSATPARARSPCSASRGRSGPAPRARAGVRSSTWAGAPPPCGDLLDHAGGDRRRERRLPSWTVRIARTSSGGSTSLSR